MSARVAERARARAAGTLGLRNPTLLRAAIRLTQRTPFGPARTPQSLELSRADGEFVAGTSELEDGPRFARRLGGAFSCADLEGKRVLDLGCGYGGRTVYYAEQCRAARVVGLEVTEAVVERCRALAAAQNAGNVSFALGVAERLPFADESFDAVVSFDVLEHVEDPGAALIEIARVLAPGGRAWLVFPTYLGARSSHLDYLTRLPALHRIFHPDTIVDVVNEYLQQDSARFATAPQPRPRVSALGRLTLPGLNGLYWRDVDALLVRAGLVCSHVVLQGLVTPDTPVPAAALASRLSDAAGRLFRWPELLIGSIGLRVEHRPA